MKKFLYIGDIDSSGADYGKNIEIINTITSGF